MLQISRFDEPVEAAEGVTVSPGPNGEELVVGRANINLLSLRGGTLEEHSDSL